jgi:hypothetical protein
MRRLGLAGVADITDSIAAPDAVGRVEARAGAKVIEASEIKPE